jgi:hypothetical protein
MHDRMNVRPLQVSDLETAIFNDRSRPGGEWSLLRQPLDS